MLQSNQGNLNPLLALSTQFRKSSTVLLKFITQQKITPLRLILLLGFTGISWLATASIAPQIAQAYTARVNLSVNRQMGDTFESFLRRAEAIARAATQRSFDSDILVTDVVVTVVGQNQGAITPILLLEVSRQAWRSRPDPQSWITYFPDTQSLLGFEEEPIVEAEQPTGQPSLPPGVPGTPAAVPPPTGPTTIDIPGAPIQIIPSPTNQAPNAPANTAQPNIPDIPGAPIQRIPNPNNPAPTNNAPANTTPPNIPDIPGAPIRRIPNPTNPAPTNNAPTTQPTEQ